MYQNTTKTCHYLITAHITRWNLNRRQQSVAYVRAAATKRSFHDQGKGREDDCLFHTRGGQRMSPQQFLHVASPSQCNQSPTFPSNSARCQRPCSVSLWRSSTAGVDSPRRELREEVAPHFSHSVASIFGPISCSRSCAQNMAEMAVGPLTQLVKDWDESDVTA